MKAAFITNPQTIELTDIENPNLPVDGCIIAVKAAAICGSDLRRWREGPIPNAEPVIPGHEIAGTVIRVGDNCRAVKVGDRLAIGPDVHCGACWYCEQGMYNLCDHLVLYGITPGRHGGFAEEMALPGELLARGIWHPIPHDLSDEAAALAEPCASVISCHEAIGTALGDWVVVMGAGPIGCIHTLIAQARGARVILSEPNPRRRQTAEIFAPEVIVDPVSEDLIEMVKAKTRYGADKVICANPIAETQRLAVELVRKGGTVVFFGGLPKSSPMTTIDANRIHYGEIRLVGSFSYHPKHHAAALDLLRRRVVAAEKFITAEFSLEQISRAFETAARGDALKIVIKP